MSADTITKYTYTIIDSEVDETRNKKLFIQMIFLMYTNRIKLYIFCKNYFEEGKKNREN